MIREKERQVASGYIALTGLLLATAVVGYWFYAGVRAESPGQIVAAVIVFTVLMFLFAGLFIVNPNEARVLQLFGKYVGSVKTPGLRYANPFYTKRKLSLRVRNFDSRRASSR